MRIVQFGVWNREAGPDFAEAAVSVNGGAPKRGCIELDPDARDWERHGHAENPAYESVILHVCLQSGRRIFHPHRAASPRAAGSARSREADARALNPQPEAKLGRCVGPLPRICRRKERASAAGAAQFRLRRKAAALAPCASCTARTRRSIKGSPPRSATKATSCRSPSSRSACRCKLLDKADADALLFGVSGFLPTQSPRVRQSDARLSARVVGPMVAAPRGFRAACHRTGSLANERPASGESSAAPARRARADRRHWPKSARWRAMRPGEIHGFFFAMSDEYWDFHYTVTSKTAPRRMALVGESRVTEMLANVFFPLAIADDHAGGMPDQCFRRSSPIGASRLPRCASSAKAAGRDCFEAPRCSRACCKSTRISACATPAIAPSAAFPTNSPSGRGGLPRLSGRRVRCRCASA